MFTLNIMDPFSKIVNFEYLSFLNNLFYETANEQVSILNYNIKYIVNGFNKIGHDLKQL